MRRVLVTDASVVVDLLGRFAAEPIETALFSSASQLVAPELARNSFRLAIVGIRVRGIDHKAVASRVVTPAGLLR